MVDDPDNLRLVVEFAEAVLCDGMSTQAYLLLQALALTYPETNAFEPLFDKTRLVGTKYYLLDDEREQLERLRGSLIRVRESVRARELKNGG